MRAPSTILQKNPSCDLRKIPTPCFPKLRWCGFYAVIGDENNSHWGPKTSQLRGWATRCPFFIVNRTYNTTVTGSGHAVFATREYGMTQSYFLWLVHQS